jgi:hypothetical protein
LPSLLREVTGSESVGAAEVLQSLGLEVNGAGKSAEVWFVGASERAEDEQREVDLPVEAIETPSGKAESGKTLR